MQKFKAEAHQLEIGLKKIIQEQGDSEQTKIKFYKDQFDWIMIKLKREFIKDENYEYIISTTYNLFISALKEDNIDSSKIESDLELFLRSELPRIKPLVAKQSTYTSEYRNYNLNTKYGRRKAREQAYRNYENGTEEYKKEVDNIKTIVWIIVIVIVFVVYILKETLK